MLDIQLLRKDLTNVAERLAQRGYSLDIEQFNALEGKRKQLQTSTEELQAKRNSMSKQIGQLKAKGDDVSAVMAEVAGLGDELKRNETDLTALQEEMNSFLLNIPNLPHESVPIGKSEDDKEHKK